MSRAARRGCTAMARMNSPAGASHTTTSSTATIRWPRCAAPNRAEVPKSWPGPSTATATSPLMTSTRPFFSR